MLKIEKILLIGIEREIINTGRCPNKSATLSHLTRKGYLTRVKRGRYRTSPQGIQRVEHLLPKKNNLSRENIAKLGEMFPIL